MRRIIVREARAGMRAARAVAHPKDAGVALLPKGAELTVAQLVMLHEQGVYDLWVEDPELAFFHDLHGARFSPAQGRLADALFKALLRFSGVKGDAAGKHSLLRRHLGRVQPFVLDLMRAAAGISGFETVAMEHEELLQHSADVAVLSVLLGWELEEFIGLQRRVPAAREEKGMLNLALAGLLHDYGETLLPEEHRESRGVLMDGESEVWKKHAGLAFGALRRQIDASTAAAILHHHQHFDGTGFGGDAVQAGAGIHIFARIVMVADTFEQMRSPMGQNRNTLQALHGMQESPVCSRCDPKVLGALLTLLPPFVPGMVVELSDRRQAVVTRTHAEYPCYPEVQVLREHDVAAASPGGAGEVIDLSRELKLHVVAVGVSRVDKHMYGRKRARITAAA